jgi:hypothetical protein
MPDWQMASARFTVFVAPDTIVPSTLWRDIVGEEPENSIVQRAVATKNENGPFAEGTLTLQVQPMRIDWVHEPSGMGSEGGLPPVLGVFPASAEPLLELGRRWAQSAWFPSAQRIAVGFVLISATPDRETGYGELRQFIDAVPNGTGATDFQYQVNRPRPSHAGIDGLRVNRLSKWSVGSYQLVVVLGGATNPTRGPLQTHLRLELDVSTTQDFVGLLPPERIESVISDLFDGAREVFEHGDHLS